MEKSQFSFSELYSCVLKATYPIEVKDRTIEPGEVIASFDKIKLSSIAEVMNVFRASGGWDNRAHVFWEPTQEVDLTFSQGVFNETQFSLLNNSKLLEKKSGEEILLSQMESLESDENGQLTFRYEPIANLFIYEKETGKKLTYKKVSEKVYSIGAPYKEVFVSYDFNYNKGASVFLVGRRLTEGYLSLEAKTRVKDDKDGRTRTGIIKIPKLKLMSDLSLVLGKSATPISGDFKAVAVPVGARGVHKAMEFFILEDDIDEDTDY